MTTRISIPVKFISNHRKGTLDLAYPQRCSRCNGPLAPQFETHPLKYEAGLIRNRQFGKKFRSSIQVTLRIPLCDLCYLANFTENPDSCDQDKTELGVIAHWRSIGIIIGSAFALAAFILLMKIIPLPTENTWMRYLWLMIIGAALLIFALTFGMTELKNRQIRKYLSDHHYNFNLHRADAFVKMQLEDPQPEDEAIVLSLENDQWAEECAQDYEWRFEKIEPKIKELEAK